VLEDKIGHSEKRIKGHEIKVRLDPIEYDVGIKTGGFSFRENVDYEV